MGLLRKGKWENTKYSTEKNKGQFVREESQFRQSITADGNFPPETGRYHLVVSLACPWAHRTVIFRKLKKLENAIGITVVNPAVNDSGWELDNSNPFHITCLHQLYTMHNNQYSGRATVPVLWDSRTQQIINNESSEIIRIFNSAFASFTSDKTDYYPNSLRKDIDKVNAFVYSNINNGVYKTGLSTSQYAYQKNCLALFNALDELEKKLSSTRYLVGNTITEADWRLFTTLIRFDCVYYNHFKANIRHIEDYPNLSNYLRDLYQQPGIAETVDFNHIKMHYYFSHSFINPTQIIPLGPDIDYTSKHNRNKDWSTDQ